jgi:hypothetical protein
MRVHPNPHWRQCCSAKSGGAIREGPQSSVILSSLPWEPFLIVVGARLGAIDRQPAAKIARRIAAQSQIVLDQRARR